MAYEIPAPSPYPEMQKQALRELAGPGEILDIPASTARDVILDVIRRARAGADRRAGSHDCLPFLKQMETAAIALGEIESGEALREQEARRLALRL